MNKLIISLLAILVSSITYGQNKQVQKLENYFSQKNYKKVIRQSNKLLDNPEYDYTLMPLLYKSIASLELYQKNTSKEELLSQSIELLEEFKLQDENGSYFTEYFEEIMDMREKYLMNAKAINREKSSLIYAKIKGIFDEDISFDDFFVRSSSTKKTEKIITVVLPKRELSIHTLRDSIIQFSEKFIGVPYKWGGISKSGFDCSGFTKYVLGSYGQEIPRIAREQYNSANKINPKKAKKGDLVFFGSKSKITHVGIVHSNQNDEIIMIHASSSRGIIIENITKSPYWGPKLVYACKVLD